MDAYLLEDGGTLLIQDGARLLLEQQGVVAPPPSGQSSAGRRRRPRQRDQFGYVIDTDFITLPTARRQVLVVAAFVQLPAAWSAELNYDDDELAITALLS